MNELVVGIEGIGFWAPGWPDWAHARAGLRGEADADPQAPTKPSPAILNAAERRRAPQPVALACEIAAQACAASGRDPAGLPSVFASIQGDLIITDYMCSTLATAPRELSPIRFHNSVHNAPAGYWTIAAQCHAPSTSISGWHASFAMALVEAAVQAITGDAPVLLAAYDTESTGPLGMVAPSSLMFGTAFVLSADTRGRQTLRMRMQASPNNSGQQAKLQDAFASIASGNPMAASALPLMTALALAAPASLTMASGVQSTLHVDLGA